MKEREASGAARGRDRVLLFLASGFGAGCSPLFPGTAGTAVAALLVLLLARSGLPAAPALIFLAAAATAGSLALGRPVERILGQKDPGLFVLDEFAGYFVSLLTFSRSWPTAKECLVAFVLFRLFDVTKPTPARQAQNLGGGTGIVLDDIVAGLYALMGVVVYRQVLHNPPW
ncbi:MAG: phosphatidylglycerophosphatase A [Planctomycetes bacterium]|nr:phosphatidylglycerophosphatase A [Planctomycetota bacterium]